jgi:hypothetical protein
MHTGSTFASQHDKRPIAGSFLAISRRLRLGRFIKSVAAKLSTRSITLSIELRAL